MGKLYKYQALNKKSAPPGNNGADKFHLTSEDANQGAMALQAITLSP